VPLIYDFLLGCDYVYCQYLCHTEAKSFASRRVGIPKDHKTTEVFAWRVVFVEGCEVQKLANRPALYIELNAIPSSGMETLEGLFHCALKDGSL